MDDGDKQAYGFMLLERLVERTVEQYAQKELDSVEMLRLEEFLREIERGKRAVVGSAFGQEDMQTRLKARVAVLHRVLAAA